MVVVIKAEEIHQYRAMCESIVTSNHFNCQFDSFVEMNILQIVFHVIVIIRISYGTIVPNIVDGYDCQAINYPYLISLSTISSGFYCGGSLLNRYNVLTAGHCCNYTRHKEQIKVYAGVSKRKGYMQTAKAWKRIVHPSVDLCILKLFSPIERTSYTNFAMLATVEIFDVLRLNNKLQHCITLGFGFQGVIHRNGTLVPSPNATRKLQCVQQKIQRRCAYAHLLCVVGQSRATQDACRGDSGSPLVCQAIQVGFVVSGFGCGLGLPSYYMKIPAVYDYIKSMSNGNILRLRIIALNYILSCVNILSEIHYCDVLFGSFVIRYLQ